LFEGRLALNPGLNLTPVSFSFVQKHFLGQFSRIFMEHRIINLLTKRTKLNLLYKFSYLNSNFALTLGYLNPALNNPAQGINPTVLACWNSEAHRGFFCFGERIDLLQVDLLASGACLVWPRSGRPWATKSRVVDPSSRAIWNGTKDFFESVGKG